MPVASRFQPKPNEYILVWPGLERVEVMWGGAPVVVPPRTDIADTGPGSPYRFEAAKLNGQRIAGTAVIRDRWGGTRHRKIKVFDALEFCTGLSQNNKPLFARGFEIVEDPNDVASVMASGIPKWTEKEILGAEATISAEIERRKYWEDKGRPAPPPTSPEALRRATSLVREHRKRQAESDFTTDELTDILSPGVPNEDRVSAAGSGVSDSDLADATAGARSVFRPPEPEDEPVSDAELADLDDPVASEPEDGPDRHFAEAQELWARAKAARVELRKDQQAALLEAAMVGTPIDEDLLEAITQRIEAAEVPA